VPQSLEGTAPATIAFLHVDMNNAAAELGALEMLFDRVAASGAIVLDDYGWTGYRAQKEVEDQFFAARGYSVLELPTGQGLVIK
jgi:O-methyltransferase